MYNQPAYDTTRITIGPGIIYLGPTGTTPSVDVGAVTGKATLTLDRSMVEIRQGSPQVLVQQLAKQEDASIEFTGIEWNLDRLAQVMADGSTSLAAVVEKLKVGGAPDNNAWALRFVHKEADGGTVEVDLWKVFGNGKISVAIDPDKPHEFPYKFIVADPGSTDWAGAALVDGQKLVQILRTKA